jgi:hypothetical protein
MKIRIRRINPQAGSVLALSVVLCGILGFLMMGYIFMTETENLSNSRTQAWQAALVVAEAGVEEAMAHLNSGTALSDLGKANGWTDIGGGNFTKTNTVTGGYSAVTIATAGGSAPVIVAKAYVPGPLSTPTLTRTVQVKTKPRTGLGAAGAMVVSTTVDFKGFGITTDSFNSTNKQYSTAGLYDPSKASDHGDVTTLSSATNAVNIQNGKIKGTVHTRPGAQVQVTSGGSVGDTAWVNGGTNGIQMNPTAHWKTDANTTFPDAALPTEPYWLAPVPGSYKINGVTYKYLINNSQPYKLGTLDGSVYFNGQNCVLWVTDGFALGSKDQIRIAGTSGSVNLYVSAANANIGGQGVVNDTGLAKNFNYYGLPSNLALSFAANAAFVGRIYAPEAAFTLGGGGKNSYDFVGQSITLSAKMNGHYNFHYDEGASLGPASGGYIAISWDEL